jgi:hypothetical protein
MSIQIDFDAIDRLRQGRPKTRAVRSSDTFRELTKAYPHLKRVLAEGDSWFAYPPKFLLFGGASNVVDCLKEDYGGHFLLDDLSSNGDEAVAMLAGDSKLGMLRRLNEEHFHILLFSGGGNDIVGRYDFDYFLLPKTADNTWQDCINRHRFERRLQQIQLAYADLVELTAQYSANPDIRIVTHTYDLAIPSKKGATFLGGLLQVDGGRSWMYPFLMDKGITDPKDQQAIVHHMLTEFKTALQQVAADSRGLLMVIDTHGTVAKNEWLNEIHPNSQGFRKVAEKIYREGIEPLLSG